MSTPLQSQTEKSKPYKGAESYQIEDGEVFYGRELDANQLIAKILSSRFTLLHAQSGAGKTSLLNARIIPGLEARGWAAFRILPENDPIAAVRAAALRYILPHPEAERQAISRALSGLTKNAESVRLDELLERYDQLEVRDPLKRNLIAPIEVNLGEDAAASPTVETFSPYFCRLLRSSIDTETFVEHFNATLRQDETAPAQPDINNSMPVTDLLAAVTESSYLSAYNKLHNELNVPGRDLSVFFDHLIGVYGSMRTQFGLVLILDQFEELFTRFVDPGFTVRSTVSELPDWTLRWDFFQQMEKLYQTPLPASDDSSAQSDDSSADKEAEQKPSLPICYVVSMRDEYIAQMGPVRRFVGPLDENSYHLMLLEKEQAKLAIQEPAALFGYNYSSECFASIIRQLTKEDRYVEPAHLQLVCEKLWYEQGRDLATDTSAGGKEISIDAFESLGGAQGILKSFFRDFLEELPEPDRPPTLELLEPLVTISGTRNIVEREQLINAPFRDPQLRRRLLGDLVNRTIVRTEARLGGYFVEITHEFLIGPILEAIHKVGSTDPDFTRVRWALGTLERLQDSPTRTLWLPEEEFLTLHTHRQRVHWNQWATELMLSSAIVHRPEPDILRLWLDQGEGFTKLEGEDVSPDLVPDIFADKENVDLKLGDLHRLNSANRESLALTSQQLISVLRAELTWAGETDREDIKYWVERVKRDDYQSSEPG
jgi:hypothetical protein